MKYNMTFRKHADYEGQVRIPHWNPETGERRLVNPATPGDQHEPWPLRGVTLEGEVPTECRVPMSVIQRGMLEGWITVEDEVAVVRPGGPIDSKLSEWHTFLHCSSITLHLLDGDLTYVVTHLPDKYAAEGDDETPVTDEMYEAGETRVDFFYELRLQGGE